MGVFWGAQKWWLDKQPIPTVLHLDAGNPSSYSGSGTTWTDLSGNGYNGTLINGVSYSSADGGSLVFDGSNDYVSLGTPALLNGLQVPLTIIVWGKLTENIGNSTLYSAYKFPADNQLYSLLRLDGGTYVKYYASTSDGGYQESGTQTISLNTWNFYAVVVSGSISSPTVKIFLNQSSETFSYAPFTSTPDQTVEFRVGAEEVGFFEGWKGNISVVKVYNTSLTDLEVAQEYDAVKSRYGL